VRAGRHRTRGAARLLGARLALLTLCALVAPAATAQPHDPPAAQPADGALAAVVAGPLPDAAAPVARAVLEINLTVSDLEASIGFFTGVLDFELLGTRELAGPEHEALEGVFGLRQRVATLRLGDERITLTQWLAPEGRPYPADSRSDDHWFQHLAIVVADMDAAFARLRSQRVRFASSGPQRLPDSNPAAGGIEAFYFKDADGHVLELLEFPADKGSARWHELAAAGDALFLGIDHTAIVVEDTDASLRFWRDGLGLAVVGHSENSGSEQEHLNNVFGARLSITSLRAASGPGVEFLEYLAPEGGRPYPAEARPNDLLHWETRLLSDDLEGLIGRLQAEHLRVRLLSRGVTSLPDGDRGVLLRDPDGHAVELHAARAP